MKEYQGSLIQVISDGRLIYKLSIENRYDRWDKQLYMCPTKASLKIRVREIIAEDNVLKLYALHTDLLEELGGDTSAGGRIATFTKESILN